MSIKMYLGEVRAQSNGALQMADSYREALGGITDSCNTFMNAPLSGKTYDSAKTYFTTVYPPLVNGLKLACEELAEAHRRFPEEYVAMVEGIDLDEAEIEKQIAEAKRVLDVQYNSIDALSKTEVSTDALERSVMRTQHLISELQKRLEKLREFNAYSPSIFSNVESAIGLVNAGISAIGQSKAWNANTGTFDLNRVNMSWAKPLREKWNEHKESKEKELEKYLDKLSEQEKAELQAQLENASEKEKANVIQSFFTENGMGIIQDFSLNVIEEYLNNHGDSIASTFYNASARNAGTEIGSALYIGGTVSKNLGKGMPIIGAVIDFGGQIAEGENATDALVKTGLHAVSGVIIGVGLTAVGITSAPFLVGVAATVTAGFIAGTLIDIVYDNKEKIPSMIGDGLKTAGDWIGSLFN